LAAPYEVVQKRYSFAGNVFEQIAGDISIRHSARVECLLVDIENPGAYLLCYSTPGVQRLDIHSVGWLKPAMGWLSLPPEAALPIITGLLIGIYGGIGVMASLPLTSDQMTLIAVFLLIAHNLIQEGIIQGKSGIHIVKITLARLLVAVAAVIVVAPFLASDTTTPFHP
jgi:hypothetical protein